MKTFEKHLHEEGTGGYPLRDILDNLTDEEIEDSVKNYAMDYALEAIKADRERVAKKAKIAFHCGTTKITHSISHYQSGADNIQIDKQSILNLDIKLP